VEVIEEVKQGSSLQGYGEAICKFLLVLVLFLLLGHPFQKAYNSVLSNRIGVKFGWNVPRVK